MATLSLPEAVLSSAALDWSAPAARAAPLPRSAFRREKDFGSSCILTRRLSELSDETEPAVHDDGWRDDGWSGSDDGAGRSLRPYCDGGNRQRRPGYLRDD